MFGCVSHEEAKVQNAVVDNKRCCLDVYLRIVNNIRDRSEQLGINEFQEDFCSIDGEVAFAKKGQFILNTARFKVYWFLQSSQLFARSGGMWISATKVAWEILLSLNSWTRDAASATTAVMSMSPTALGVQMEVWGGDVVFE